MKTFIVKGRVFRETRRVKKPQDARRIYNLAVKAARHTRIQRRRQSLRESVPFSADEIEL